MSPLKPVLVEEPYNKDGAEAVAYVEKKALSYIMNSSYKVRMFNFSRSLD